MIVARELNVDIHIAIVDLLKGHEGHTWPDIERTSDRILHVALVEVGGVVQDPGKR